MLGAIDVFTDPAGQVAAPTGIIGVGDGIWFTSIANSRIGRVTPATGRIETFLDPSGDVALPANIFPGADGRIWFTCLGSSRLASIEPASPQPESTIRTYADPRLDTPVALKAAADGLLWFSLRGGDGAIGCLDPRDREPIATLRIFTSPLVRGPSALFVHPTGSIWWVNADDGTLGCLDPSVREGGMTILGPWPDLGSPRAWAIDDDHHFWVTTQDAPGILTFNPTAADPGATVRWVTDDRLRTPDGIWTGADGALWLADTGANAIVRHDPGAHAGDARGADMATWGYFGAPPEVDGPFDIKSGGDPADGSLWFSNKGGNSIGRIRTRP